MASYNFLHTEYTDFELLDYNPQNSLVVQRAKTIKTPQKNVIWKGLSTIDEVEIDKLKNEFDVLEYIHFNLRELYASKTNDAIPDITTTDADSRNTTTALGTGSKLAAGTAANLIASPTEEDSLNNSGNVVGRTRRPSAANIRKLQNFLGGELSGDPFMRIIKPVDFVAHNEHTVMILEDIGGISLRQYMRELVYPNSTSSGMTTSHSTHFGSVGNIFASELSLSPQFPEKSITCEEFLTIALQVTEALDIIHSMGISHRDICPENIIIKKLANIINVQLIDFNAAEFGNTESYVAGDGVIHGNLPYMSPEQTGRMEQPIDYRTGITLWELLIGRKPYDFDASDIAEYVHSHLAVNLIPPHELNPNVPEIFSRIIAKLAHKSPDMRYQSASGIRYDLSICLKQIRNLFNSASDLDLTSDKNSATSILNNFDFKLGTKDFADKLKYPMIVGWRDAEKQRLIDTFERVATGTSAKEICVISGAFGQGKSSLAHQLQAHVTMNCGIFINGKYDINSKSRPYHGILEALEVFINHVLSVSNEEFEYWHNLLIESVGVEKLSIITELLPDLKVITDIGADSTLIQDSLTLSCDKNGFTEAFVSFLAAIARPQQPLVIFLDDIEVADQPSLTLLQDVLTNDQVANLFLIVSATETFGADPNIGFCQILNHLKGHGKVVPGYSKIELESLKVSDIFNFLKELLNPVALSQEELQTFAVQVHSKTLGNAYHIKEFVMHAERKGFIYLDKVKGGWTWEINNIENHISIAENVVDFMLHRMQSFPPETFTLLKYAACIGNRFDLRCLSYLADTSLNVLASQLWLAIKEGLLVPSTDSRMTKQPARLSRSSSNNLSPPLVTSQPKISGTKNLEKLGERIAAKTGLGTQYAELMFSHDRLQYASYKFLPDNEKKQIHLKISRILRKNFVDDDADESMLEIVRHLNEAQEIVTEPEERHLGIKLNFLAGMRAKRSNAHDIAKQFFLKSLSYYRSAKSESKSPPLSPVDDGRDLIVKVMKSLIQIHLMDFENEEAEALCKEALKLTRSMDDRLQITDMLLPLFMYKMEFANVLSMATECLGALGLSIPKDDEELQKAYQTERDRFEVNIKRENLLDILLSPNTHKHGSTAGKYIYDALSAADHLGMTSTANYLAVKGCNLIIESGVREKASEIFSFVTKVYFDIPEGELPDLEKLRWFSELTSKLMETSPIDSQVSSLTHLWNCGQAYVLAQNRQLEPAVRKCVARSKESESRVSLRMLFVLFANQIHQGHPSAIIRETTKIPTRIIDRISSNHSILQESWNRCIGCFDSLCSGEAVEELSLPSSFVPSVPLNSVRETLMYLIMVIYETSGADEATNYMLASLKIHRPVIRYMSIAFQITRMLAIRYSNSTEAEVKNSILKQIDDQIAWLRHLTSSPSNDHHCKYLLAMAEKNRITGCHWEALKNYEAGIDHAKKNGLTLWEAFGTELYARFFVEQGNTRLAKSCMQSAYHLWKSWGSDGKAKQLYSRYSDYINDSPSHSSTGGSRHHQLNKVINLNNNRMLRTSTHKMNSATATNLDVSTMLKVAQSITNESNLEELLAKVIKYVMLNAGAKKGVLILNDGGKLFVQAYTDSVDGLQQTKVLKEGIPIEKVASMNQGGNVPLAIVLFVFRSREHVVLHDASSDNTYSGDPYVRAHGPRSLLCVPIVHQNTVSGVLYLENDTQNGVFTTDRVEVIKSLMASTAISMENAKLTKKNTELANALKQQNQETMGGNNGPRYNIDAPIKKTIDVLSQMKASLPPNDPTVKQIEFVMRTLTSTDLFASSIDEINDEQGRGIDQDTKNWIENSLLQKSSRRPVLNRENSKDSMMTNFNNLGKSTSMDDCADMAKSQNIISIRTFDLSTAPNSKEIEAQLELASTADFDVFKFAEVTHGRPLYYLGCHYLEKYGLLQHFNMSEEKVKVFFETVESSYLKLPYHNSSHAADVLQTVNLLLLSDQKMAEHFSKLDILAACVASAVHDVDHPGLNNNFLVQSGHKLAVMYNDVSVLEFHHASKAFQIVSKSESNIFSGMANDQFRDVRKLIIGMVVATDMAQHFQYINKLKGKIAASSLRLEDPADRSLVLEMAIKCADLNNPAKPTDQCTKWAYSVMQEFFVQGDLERRMGIPVSKFMDRNDTNIPRWQVYDCINNSSQIGFIDILVTPLFDSWSQCIQTDFTRRCMDNISRNREYWESLLNNLDAVPKFPEPSEDIERAVSIDFDTTFSFGRKVTPLLSQQPSSSSSQQQQQQNTRASVTKAPKTKNSRPVSQGSNAPTITKDRRSSATQGTRSHAKSSSGGSTVKRTSISSHSPVQSLPDLPTSGKERKNSLGTTIHPGTESNVHFNV